MNFRLANDNDFEPIYSIWQQGIKVTFSDSIYPDNLKDLFFFNFSNRKEFFDYWVIENNGVQGWCSLSPMFVNPLKQFKYAEVSTYINNDLAISGLGQSIMNHVFNCISKSPIKAVYGFANLGNKKSIQMCQKAGMIICGTTSTKTILIREF